MLAVKGYYNGKRIILDKDYKLKKRQKVVVTIIDVDEQVKKRVDFMKYKGIGKGIRNKDAQEYIKDLRNNDRC